MDDQNNTNQVKSQEVIKAILHALGNIRFGSVEIVIHDSHVVQIERKEKLRLTSDGVERGR